MSNAGLGDGLLLLATDRWRFRRRRRWLIRRNGSFLRCSDRVSGQAEDLMEADARLNRLQSLLGKIRQFGRRLDFGAGFYERLIDGAESEFQFLILSRRFPAFTEFHRDLFLAMLKFSLRRERFLQPALQPAQLGVHR